ncbi:MAG: NAD(P)/FAD-dependent oxidoreductase [Sandaracinaceae bacterium]
MKTHDLIVLGAGNAGLAAASIANEAGWSVLVAESLDVGGTCPLRGCVPKKVLVAAAEALDVIRRASAHGITVSEPKLDWGQLIRRERTFVEGVPAQFAESLARRGIELMKGHARFVSEDSIEVDGRRFTAEKILVATGSAPRQLAIPGFEHALSSADLLAREALPRSIAFVGAGVIGFELAHVLARAGSQVTLLEVAERPLPRNDPDQVAELVRVSEAIGIEVRTEVRVEALARHGDGSLAVEVAGETDPLRVDVVANAAGRAPALSGLALDAAGISWDGATVPLAGPFRSAENGRVFFAGDALPGRPLLSPVATLEGKLAGRHIVHGEETEPRYDAIPSAIYTVPTLASVGLTERAAADRGLDVGVKVSDMRSWRSARTYAEEAAWAKVLFERGTDRVVGAHLVGHGAAETVHAFASAIEHGWTASYLKSRSYAYPTFHADLKYLV